MTNSKNYEITIAVDLDGTLTLTDTLYESLLILLRNSFFYFLLLPFWLLGGKAAFKAKVADRVDLNVATLPYNEALIDWLKEERSRGRSIVLCTAADQRLAHAVADHLGLFDEVLASNGITNNLGANKRAALDAKYGLKGYDYAGNSFEDLIVWAGARQAVVVNAGDAVLQKVVQIASETNVLPPKALSLSNWIKLFRVHQWLKNSLIFVPLFAAHRVENIDSLIPLTLAFMSFCLCASAMYILNDLIDLESDRKHPRKSNRPLASAAVSIKVGIFFVPLLAVIGIVFGMAVDLVFIAWLALYLALTTAYTLVLKRLILIDCLTLAGLYTLRIVAGAVAVNVPLSFWLLAFSVFIFLSLAFLKRYAELQVQASIGNSHAHGRGYAVTDAPLLQTLGITAGYAAVLVLALYLQSEAVIRLYTYPILIWLLVPLMLFWVSWVWMVAHRGNMHDDPVVFALKDRASLTVGALTALSLFFAAKGMA